jgi:SAM-dependent methyltransferase
LDEQAYFDYLRTRSSRALAYRRRFLYPRLCRQLRGRALDVGCGIGDLLAFRPGTVGVDVNRRAVAWCRQQGLDARESQAGRLPFEAAEFDSAILDNVLEHIAEPEDLLREVHRVVARGGVLIVGVPGERGFAADPDHKVYYDEVRLRATVERAGFRTVRALHVPFRARWLSRVLASYCVYGIFERAA